MNDIDKVLIIYIDLDNDLADCGIETPIKGLRRAKDVALHFGLCKPKDTDVNALLRAIQISEDMIRRGINADIAIVAGSKASNDYERMLALNKQLEILKKEVGNANAIVVFDSVEDEKALPLISQYFKVIAVETVVVEQARSIETAYTVLSKIAKKIVTDRSYARMILGYPGFALFILILLSLFHLVQEAIYAILLFVSVLMILKGFGLYDRLKGFSQQPIKIFSVVLMATLMFIAIYLMSTSTLSYLSSGVAISKAVGIAIGKYSHIVVIAIAIPFFMRMLRAIQYRDSSQILLNIAILVDIMLSYILLQNIALVIQGESEALALAITNSIAVALAMAIVTTISEVIVKGQGSK